MTEEIFNRKIKEEGDFLEFHHLGFKCQIIRHKDFNHLNGYIFLTSDNDYFGFSYTDIDVRVHCGWTYCRQDGDFWIVGFDCAHLGDITSHFFVTDSCRQILSLESTYKDMKFVKSELECACEDFQKKSKSYRRKVNLSRIFKDKYA